MYRRWNQSTLGIGTTVSLAGSANSVVYSFSLLPRSFCRFLGRNRCRWTFFSPVVVVSAILFFSMGVVLAILHLMAEFADFGDVWLLTVFIRWFCRCRWSLRDSACLDISGRLLSSLCIVLSTETEALSPLETAGCWFDTLAVVVDRLSIINARAR